MHGTVLRRNTLPRSNWHGQITLINAAVVSCTAELLVRIEGLVGTFNWVTKAHNSTACEVEFWCDGCAIAGFAHATELKLQWDNSSWSNYFSAVTWTIQVQSTTEAGHSCMASGSYAAGTLPLRQLTAKVEAQPSIWIDVEETTLSENYFMTILGYDEVWLTFSQVSETQAAFTISLSVPNLIWEVTHFLPFLTPTEFVAVVISSTLGIIAGFRVSDSLSASNSRGCVQIALVAVENVIKFFGRLDAVHYTHEYWSEVIEKALSAHLRQRHKPKAARLDNGPQSECQSQHGSMPASNCSEMAPKAVGNSWWYEPGRG